MNWSFMNSELRVKSECTVYELKMKLAAKHGAMKDLKASRGHNTLTEAFTDDNAPASGSRSRWRWRRWYRARKTPLSPTSLCA